MEPEDLDSMGFSNASPISVSGVSSGSARNAASSNSGSTVEKENGTVNDGPTTGGTAK